MTLLVAGVTARAEESAALPPARQCAELYRLYWEYVGDWVFYGEGERVFVELGNYRCQRGQLEEGSRLIEAVLRRNKMPFPNALPIDSSRNLLAAAPGS